VAHSGPDFAAVIFDCGETLEARKARLEQWHDFYPLFPRRVDVVNGRAVCAWLQTIERKGVYYSYIEHSFWIWEYRLKQNV
jgi:hypothetical protein